MCRVHAVLILVLLALAAACSGGGGPAIEESELPQLVLQPSDLPEVWVRFDEGRQVGADAPAGRRADPNRFDRKGGWKARYRRSGTPSTAGPLVIESRADIFGDVEGAEEDLDLLEEDLNASIGGLARRIDAPDVGDKAVAAVATQGTVRFLSIAWRQENVVAAMVVNGFVGSLTFGDVLSLARKQEQRIGAAAG